MTEETITPRTIADRYLDHVAAHNPLEAAWLGLHPGDDRQPDLSPEGFEALADIARRTLTALDTLEARAAAPPADEDPADRNCARLLRERLTAELALHDTGENFRQLRTIGAHVHQVRDIFTFMPTATDDDWAAVAGRLRNLPAALDGYRATLAEGISRGLTAAPRQTAAVVDQLTAWTGENAEGDGSGWFAGFVAPGPEGLRGELDAAALKATAAVAGFRDWLRDTYTPAAADTPDAVGRERYGIAVRHHTGADPDLDEAYTWAWSEFHRTVAEMRTEADRVLPGAGVQEAMGHLERHGHTVIGEEAIRDWLQQLMDEAITALDGTHFDLSGPLRRVESRIAPTGSSAAPYYQGPSLDFSRPGRTFLPTLGRDTFPTWQLVSTWYHEGVPGHHLQLARWVSLADRLSRYQTTLGMVSANIEGWALYAERLMDDLGFLTDPARRLGFLDEQMLRTIRVIIDIGMHLGSAIPADAGFHPGERWTPALATEFLATYTGSSADMRDSEIVRYLGWPGQAIGYKLGERVWLQGREAARRRRGTSFDLKTWHMKALSQGSLGLDDLAGRLAVL
ncbi:DUF885 domain-containing protein [Streptomyces clavuligerus]|nr:DUF885 domain-containing protein [Streptomyces clavuligerus]EDY49632.1 conserved hypothetical protein [Streptomyces clavuligerus]MBY6307452.1 DUF885 domain-containing protein [Streptomyces clavuligerus]QCS09988.1 DUF885 domain-containing protein [Streptomyces clavuligerus]QPJ97970.1 DUF885 family protein [Streptomyces clavuligerus]WDN56695.1 DUF885 domain-containing protein [Streptomyces clavuligerus]